MRIPGRLFLYLPTALFFALATGVALYWHFAADALEQRLDAMNGHDFAPGIRIRFASRAVTGFPFRLDAVLDNVSLETQRTSGPLRWQSEHVAVHALSYAPSQILMEAAGKQRLSWTGDNGQKRQFAFETGSFHASAIRREGQLARFDLDVIGARWEGGSAGRLQFHLRRNPDTRALDLVLSGDMLRPQNSALGKEISHFALSGTASQADAFDALLAGRADWRAAMASWQERKGVLAVASFALSATHADFSATGTLHLDSYHRPEGSVAVSVTTHEAVQTLERADTDSIAGTILTLARQMPAGQTIKVPLDVRDGLVRAGGLAAAKADPIY